MKHFNRKHLVVLPLLSILSMSPNKLETTYPSRSIASIESVKDVSPKPYLGKKGVTNSSESSILPRIQKERELLKAQEEQKALEQAQIDQTLLAKQREELQASIQNDAASVAKLKAEKETLDEAARREQEGINANSQKVAKLKAEKAALDVTSRQEQESLKQSEQYKNELSVRIKAESQKVAKLKAEKDSLEEASKQDEESLKVSEQNKKELSARLLAESEKVAKLKAEKASLDEASRKEQEELKKAQDDKQLISKQREELSISLKAEQDALKAEQDKINKEKEAIANAFKENAHPKYDAVAEKIDPKSIPKDEDLNLAKFRIKRDALKAKVEKDNEEFKKDISDKDTVSAQREKIVETVKEILALEADLKELQSRNVTVKELEDETRRMLSDAKDSLEILIAEVENNEELVAKASKEVVPALVVAAAPVTKTEPCPLAEQNKILNGQVEMLLQQQNQVVQALLAMMKMMLEQKQQQQIQPQMPNFPMQSPYHYNQPFVSGNWIYAPSAPQTPGYFPDLSNQQQPSQYQALQPLSQMPQLQMPMQQQQQQPSQNSFSGPYGYQAPAPTGGFGTNPLSFNMRNDVLF